MSSAFVLNAQEVQLATLQQGEDLHVFYGADALKNALDSANSGDLITLSAGTFNGVNITKAITIQGAGYVTDVATGRYPTAINGNITINPQGGEIEGLVIEGIFSYNTILLGNDNAINATACTIKKSLLNSFYLNSNANSQTKNCLIDQCRINVLRPDMNSENLDVRNSVIGYIESNNSSATLLIENCVMTNVAAQTTAVYKNNIIGGVSGYFTVSLQSNSSAYNNVFINGDANGVVNQSGNMTSDENTLFGYAISYDDSKTYELTPSAQATFLGTDGTQVGIYGGETPFTNVPSNPQILSKNIATKSTPDGKLNVSIKVEAQNQ